VYFSDGEPSNVSVCPNTIELFLYLVPASCKKYQTIRLQKYIRKLGMAIDDN